MIELIIASDKPPDSHVGVIMVGGNGTIAPEPWPGYMVESPSLPT